LKLNQNGSTVIKQSISSSLNGVQNPKVLSNWMT